MTWVEELLLHIHRNDKKKVKRILDDIDRRWVTIPLFEFISYSYTLSVVITPPFAGLRHFPQGRGFKQWTGNDSKALMKVCSNSNMRK